MVAKQLHTSLIPNWETPEEILYPLVKEFGPFELDAAADAQNAKAPKFFSLEDSAFQHRWTGLVWLNPPYGKGIGDWIQKAYLSSIEDGATVVCLVPARTDTAWWRDWVMGKAEVRFLRGRVRFKTPKGLRMSAAPFPSALLVYRGHG